MANLTKGLTKLKMDNVCIVSGELDGDVVGEATFNDHGGANQSSGDDSVGKQQEKEPTFGEFRKESTYTYYDDELVKKKEVNSTGSRLCMCRDCRIICPGLEFRP